MINRNINFKSLIGLSIFILFVYGSNENSSSSSLKVKKQLTVEEKLSGEWHADQESFTGKLFLNKDGTGYEDNFFSGKWQKKENITWEYGTATYSNKPEEYDYIKVTNPNNDSYTRTFTFIINYKWNDKKNEILHLERRFGSQITGTYKRVN